MREGRKSYLHTNVGNAERLVDKYGEHIRYVPLWKKWIVWDGQRWNADASGDTAFMASVMFRRMASLRRISSERTSSSLSKNATRSRSSDISASLWGCGTSSGSPFASAVRDKGCEQCYGGWVSAVVREYDGAEYTVAVSCKNCKEENNNEQTKSM